MKQLAFAKRCGSPRASRSHRVA